MVLAVGTLLFSVSLGLAQTINGTQQNALNFPGIPFAN
jgi:hypothetical protein